MADVHIDYGKVVNFLNAKEEFIGRKELIGYFPEIESELSFPDQLSNLPSEIKVISIFNKAPKDRDDWDDGLVDELYCSKRFYLDLLSDLSEEYISEQKDQIDFGYLSMMVGSNLGTYLGLDKYWVTGFSNDDLWRVIVERSSKFLLSSESKFDERDKYRVTLSCEKPLQNNNQRLLLQIQKILHSNKEISITRLLVKVNLSSFDFGIPKPLSLEYLRKFIESSNHLSINGDILTIKSLSSRLNYATTIKNNIADFDKSLNLPGLLIFSFNGKTFPIKEATEYINLRPIVFISITKNLTDGVIEFSNSDASEMIKNLKGFLGVTDIYQWIGENLAVSFIIEDYDYLKLNFDKLMQEYSPVLNLDKNPGNLFRGIIEEKIRESDSGKES
jgi:hypothetical protein